MTAYQQQTHIFPNQTWYVSDLPGHNGTTRIKVGDGVRSDWGFTTDRRKAINLSPYWVRRFRKYSRDINRPCGFIVDDRLRFEPTGKELCGVLR